MNKLTNFFIKLLTKSPPEKTSNIPVWLIEKSKIGNTEIRNAATKIIKASRKVELSESDIKILYEIELRYEKSKTKAKQDYPHVRDILKDEIQKAKNLKCEEIRQLVGELKSIKILDSQNRNSKSRN